MDRSVIENLRSMLKEPVTPEEKLLRSIFMMHMAPVDEMLAGAVLNTRPDELFVMLDAIYSGVIRSQGKPLELILAHLSDAVQVRRSPEAEGSFIYAARLAPYDMKVSAEWIPDLPSTTTDVAGKTRPWLAKYEFRPSKTWFSFIVISLQKEDEAWRPGSASQEGEPLLIDVTPGVINCPKHPDEHLEPGCYEWRRRRRIYRF